MNFGKKVEPTIHLGVLPTPHETPRWSLEATAAGHRRFPPKKTAAEFRDRSHLRVDVGRKVMGTWRQEVILWICGRWMNFCQHHDLKGSHKVMPIGNWDFPSSRKTTPSEICWPLRKNGEVKTVKIPNYSIWCLISLIHSSLSYCISTNTVVRLRIVMIIVEYQFSTR